MLHRAKISRKRMASVEGCILHRTYATGHGAEGAWKKSGSLHSVEEASIPCPRRAAEESRDYPISADWLYKFWQTGTCAVTLLSKLLSCSGSVLIICLIIPKWHTKSSFKTIIIQILLEEGSSHPPFPWGVFHTPRIPQRFFPLHATVLHLPCTSICVHQGYIYNGWMSVCAAVVNRGGSRSL